MPRRSKAAKRGRLVLFEELETRTLLSNLPDLTVSSATAPSTAVVDGQTIPIRWTVTNQGADIPGPNSWADAVYLAPVRRSTRLRTSRSIRSSTTSCSG